MPTRNGAEDVLLANIVRRQVLEALAPQHQASLAVAAEDDRRTGNARREGALAQYQRAHLAGGRDHGNPIAAAHAFQGIDPRERAVSAGAAFSTGARRPEDDARHRFRLSAYIGDD